MIKKIFISVILCLTCCFFMAATSFGMDSSSDSSVSFHVLPELVKIGIRFDGLDLHVSGTIPSDCEAVVRIMGHERDFHLKKKGKAMGLLWMNLGKIQIKGVPEMMLVYPSKSLYELSKNNKGQWEKLGIGFESLEDVAKVLPASEDKSKIFKEFIKLETSLDLYGTTPGALTYGNVSGSVKSFKAEVRLPSNVPHDGFRTELYAVRDGKIIAEQTKDVKVKLVGIPARISFLAFNHGTLYGVIAVIIAILAGIIVGVVFREGGGAH